MTFTYTAPGANDVSTIRFLLGDTTDADHLLEDEEIAWANGLWFPIWQSLFYVASVLAENIAARYAREASISADGISVSLGPVGDQFKALAITLRDQHKSLLVGGFPDVGGISPYEERDPDVKNFSFGIGMGDDAEAGNQNYGDPGLPFYPAEQYPGGG